MAKDYYASGRRSVFFYQTLCPLAFGRINFKGGARLLPTAKAGGYPPRIFDEWARLKELMYDVCGVEETPAKEIFKYRNAPCFYPPAPFSPEEAQYERLYRKNKLIIDGVPIRWGEPPCFTWCTKSNTPACQKIFNQQSMFTTGGRPKPIPKNRQQNLFD